MNTFWRWLEKRNPDEIEITLYRYTTSGELVFDFEEFRDGDPVTVYDVQGYEDGAPVWVGLKGIISEWPSLCPTCGATDCPNLKNSAAMCPGPKP